MCIRNYQRQNCEKLYVRLLEILLVRELDQTMKTTTARDLNYAKQSVLRTKTCRCRMTSIG